MKDFIEHTILKPDATTPDIERVVREAVEYGFFGVCINPNFVNYARNLIDVVELEYIAEGVIMPHKPRVVTVVNFPLASNKLATTVFQTAQAVKDGADEIDTVINISALKEKKYDEVEKDIKETKSTCCRLPLKVILETDLLTTEEIEIACRISVNSGADFVKTSTGFVSGGVGATVENVALMHKIVSPSGLKVKASGGIKTPKQARAMIEAGAQRLGTSSGVQIVNEGN